MTTEVSASSDISQDPGDRSSGVSGASLDGSLELVDDSQLADETSETVVGGVDDATSRTPPATPNECLLVKNELLCYASCYLNSATPENIMNIILANFNDTEIVNAKSLLWSESNKPFLKKMQKRRDTVQRKCSEANMLDIMEALATLDKKTDGPPVIYVAADLHKLPNVSPEEVNQVSMLKRLLALEKKFNSLENGVSSNMIEVGNTNEKLQKLHDLVDTQNERIESVAQLHSAIKEVSSQSSDEHDYESADSSGDETEDDTNEVEGAGPSVEPVREATVDSRNDNVTDEASSGNALSAAGQDDKHSDAASHKKSSCNSDCHRNLNASNSLGARRRPKESRLQRDAREATRTSARRELASPDGAPGVVVGNSVKSMGQWSRPLTFGRTDKSGFTMPRQQWRNQQRRSRNLFVFNVPKSCSEKDVSKYVASQNIKVIDICQRSHPEARKKSFVLQVSPACVKRVMTSSFWPKGVKVRVYVEKDSQ